MKNNMKHCELRNNFFLQETKKSWRNAITNRPIVLRSMARTNVIKRDTDEWLAKMDEQILNPDSVNPSMQIEGEDEGELVQKYN